MTAICRGGTCARPSSFPFTGNVRGRTYEARSLTTPDECVIFTRCKISQLISTSNEYHTKQHSRNQFIFAFLGVFVSPMKIPLPLRGIRVIREIRGQKKQPRITQISRKTHHKSHLHSQWRAAGSWKLGGDAANPYSPPRHKDTKSRKDHFTRRLQ